MSAVIVFSSKKYGPITLLHKSPHHTLLFGLSGSISLVMCRFSVLEILALCLLSFPDT